MCPHSHGRCLTSAGGRSDLIAANGLYSLVSSAWDQCQTKLTGHSSAIDDEWPVSVWSYAVPHNRFIRSLSIDGASGKRLELRCAA